MTSNTETASTETSEQAVVLVVDDEPTICWAFERLLRDEGHQVVSASTAEEGLRIAQESRPSLVLLDVRLPKQDGISALPSFIEATGGAPVVVMTAFGDLETAVNAVQRGASDYLTKPFSLDDALRVCHTALRAVRVGPRAPTPMSDVSSDQGKIIGRSPAIQHAFRQIALVAASELSVLITGETGTGKELVAAAIHRNSHRRDGPYLPIAPVALNPDLIESELFGHVKGAFTGADTDRAGLFERAEHGTILLDEIGDLPLRTQVKLLRVIEEGQYCRVGEIEPRRCDVRILAATNSDLHQAVAENRFREDLFYRLNGLHIHLPPLRDRPEDIKPLCEHFLMQLGYPLNDSTLDDSLIDTLSERNWAGSVRELRNAVQHAAVHARGRPLVIEDFPESQPMQLDRKEIEPTLEQVVTQWTENSLREERGSENGLHDRLLAEVEPALLRAVLEHTRGNRVKAAEILGIHRGTLREKLRGYGIDLP